MTTLALAMTSLLHTSTVLMTMSLVVNCQLSDENNPVGLVCWTCNKSDNEACNKWAPNRSCPGGWNVCKTTHRFNTLTARSIAVNKQCTTTRDCTIHKIGCRRIGYLPHTVECTSCCDYPYCNEEVPSNDTAAHLLSTISVPSVASRLTTSPLTSSYDVIIVVVVLATSLLAYREHDVTSSVCASKRSVLDRRKHHSTSNDVISICHPSRHFTDPQPGNDT